MKNDATRWSRLVLPGCPHAWAQIACFLVVLLILSFTELDQAKAQEFQLLVIETKTRALEFEVEYAGTPSEQARGLMFRTELAPFKGMIFDFGEARVARFWMRNTLIELDILFLDENGNIQFIEHRATPLSESIISPGIPSLGVLEIAGGEAKRLGVEVGDRVVHAMFQ